MRLHYLLRLFRVALAALAAAALLELPVATSAQDAVDASHMTFLGHVDMDSGGEGLAMKMTAAGRRVLFVAHEAPPGCFDVIDVTDPRAPRVIERVPVPVPSLSCNSLDIAGNILAVAGEMPKQGDAGGAVRFWDVSDPMRPRFISAFDTSGPHSRGTHHVWFESPTRLHIATGYRDFEAKRPGKDERFYMALDVSDPAKPRELGRWWMPGQRVGDAEPAPESIPQNGKAPANVQPHNIDVFPAHPNRAYIGYIDGGIVILDTSDIRHPKPVSIVTYDAPGYTHTAFPLFARNLLVVSEEETENACGDDAHRVTVWDISDEKKPRFLSVAPFAANAAALCKLDARYGAHNIFEDKPNQPTYQSDRYIVASFFSGGVRIFDLADPLHPKEAGYYVPATPPGHVAIQINDVYVDDRGIVYACDRFNGGLFLLSSGVLPPQRK